MRLIINQMTIFHHHYNWSFSAAHINHLLTFKLMSNFRR